MDIRLRYSPDYLEESTIHSLTNTFTHELGHAFDYYFRRSMSQDKKDNWTEIFRDESPNMNTTTTLDEYGKKDENEFFAEVFAKLYSNDVKRIKAIKKQTPLAVKFIETEIQDNINN